MSDQTDNNADNQIGGMNIDIGHISASGHVVIAGRDATVEGNTLGDASQNQNIITVGGVKASREEFDALKQSLDDIDTQIAESDLDDDQREAAQENAKTLRKQMTSTRKPNAYTLTQAATALYKFGPKIAGAVVAVFMGSLAGNIVESAGEKALTFYRKLQQGELDLSLD